MRRTKIIATIGPTCEQYEQLEALLLAGVNVFRLNFSHGSHEWYAEIIKRLKRLNQKHHSSAAILLDTKGPEIRTADVKSPFMVAQGDELILTTEQVPYEDSKKLSVNYDSFLDDVEVGQKILIDNGLIGLKVEKKTKQDVYCQVLDNGEISSRRHLNIPGKEVSLQSITDRDWLDIKFGLEQGVDFIALSFVRSGADIEELRRFLQAQHSHVRIVAKVESFEATNNLESICQAADAIMVARGDLGAEIPFSEVPKIQRKIGELGQKYGHPVIVATHMLESMINNPMPTRAEVMDITAATWQKADAIMLSAETANGEYPTKAVMAMDEVARASEQEMYFSAEKMPDESTVSDLHRLSLAQAAKAMLQERPEIAAMVVITRSGYMAQLISQLRPVAPILAFTNEAHTRRKMQLLWGVSPFRIEFSSDPEKTVVRAKEHLLQHDSQWKGKYYVLLSDFLVQDSFVPTIQIRQW